MSRLSDSAPPHDVSITGPGVLPWASFCGAVDVYSTGLDKLQYPMPTRELRYKALWRGLEDVQGWTFKTLFESLSAWQDVGAPRSVGDLKELLGCEVSYNWGSTCLYIGTDTDSHYPADGTERLDTLLKIAVSA